MDGLPGYFWARKKLGLFIGALFFGAVSLWFTTQDKPIVPTVGVFGCILAALVIAGLGLAVLANSRRL